MGIRPTILPWLVFLAGSVGGTVALAMQWYCNAPHAAAAKLGGLAGNPLIVSGKPYWSLPANIPIIFELSVLFAALMAFVGLWALVRLPRLHFPDFRQPTIPPGHRRRLFLGDQGRRQTVQARADTETF